MISEFRYIEGKKIVSHTLTLGIQYSIRCKESSLYSGFVIKRVDCI